MSEEETTVPRPPRFVRPIAGILFAALGAILIVLPEQTADLTGYNALNAHAAGLVDETLMRDQATFLVISGIKASLAMIEGSTVGIGIEVQVGDVVQPAYDYVDFFWRMFLYAFLIMGFYKLLLETGLLMLGLSLAGIGFVLLAVALWLRTPRLNLWLWGRRCVLGGLLFAYITPASLIATHALSQRYMQPIQERHAAAIGELEGELEKTTLRFAALKGQISLLQPGKSLDELKTGMMNIVTQVGETVRMSLLAFMYYVLIVLIEILFFPFLSAYVLYKFGQFAVGRVLWIPATAPQIPAPAAG